MLYKLTVNANITMAVITYNNIEQSKEILYPETADIQPCLESPNNVVVLIVREPYTKEALVAAAITGAAR